MEIDQEMYKRCLADPVIIENRSNRRILRQKSLATLGTKLMRKIVNDDDKAVVVQARFHGVVREPLVERELKGIEVPSSPEHEPSQYAL